MKILFCIILAVVIIGVLIRFGIMKLFVDVVCEIVEAIFD